jgi:hypothetical protein
LVRAIKDLQALAGKTSSSFFPINELPTEVLPLIFSFVPLDLWDGGRLSRGKYNEWPGGYCPILCMVCTRWQALILSDPTLWSTIVVDATQFEIEDLQLYLHLSRNHYLTLYLEHLDEKAVLALEPHTPRIRHLYDGRDRIWTIGISQGVGNLTSRTVRCNRGLRFPVEILSLDVVLDAPSLEVLHQYRGLQEISIDFRNLDQSLVRSKAKLPCLTTLTINYFVPPILRDFYAILSPQKLQTFIFGMSWVPLDFEEYASLLLYIGQMPVLASISFKCLPSWDSWGGDLITAQWPSTIRHLSVVWNTGSNPPPLHSDFLEIQSLEELHLDCFIHPQFSLSRCRSTKTLRTLELVLGSVDIGDTVEETQHIDFPCLEVLLIKGPLHYTASFLRRAFAPLLLRLELFISKERRYITSDWRLADFFDCSSGIRQLSIKKFVFKGLEGMPPLRELRTLRILLEDWNDLVSWETPELSELSLELRVLRPSRKSEVDPDGGADLEIALAFFQDRVPLHQFRNLKHVSFITEELDVFVPQALIDGFITFLEMTPSLVTILLPYGRFLFGPDEVPIDRLAKKLMERPSFCPNIQEIGSHEYPTDWVSFLQMLTGRFQQSLLSSTGLPKSIRTLRFHLLPHPHIVQQLEDSMRCLQLTLRYSVPPCIDPCIYSRGIQHPKARAHRKNKVCFMCHTGRLEHSCEGSASFACRKWEDRMYNDLWRVISL